MQWSIDMDSVFVLILLYVLQEFFQTNYPSVVSAIGMCYRLRKHSHASLSVSLYRSLMWMLSHDVVYTSEVDFWMYHWCMVLHVYMIFWCTTGYQFHCTYSKLHTDTVCQFSLTIISRILQIECFCKDYDCEHFCSYSIHACYTILLHVITCK